MRITISGIVGSGKTTITKMLCKELNYQFYSVGGFMREIAKKRKLHLSELSKIAEKDREIDIDLDERQKKLNFKDNFVIDSRLGFYFIKDSFDIFLKVDICEAVKRICKANRGQEDYKDEKECEVHLKRRIESEKIRYKQYYGIDYPDESKFDLVIDTTNKTIKEVIGEIFKKIESRD